MQKLKLILFFCLIILSSFRPKPYNDEKVLWLKLDEVAAKVKEQSKPVLIDLYTDWCYWCKVMDKKTYSKSKVISYINEHFYCSRINAESKEVFNWNEKNYNYNAYYKVNNFAMYITSGQLSFPTTVIIPEENAAPIPVSGFMEPKELELILRYFGDGDYKTKTFPEYQKTFRSSW